MFDHRVVHSHVPGCAYKAGSLNLRAVEYRAVVLGDHWSAVGAYGYVGEMDELRQVLERFDVVLVHHGDEW